MKFDTKEDRIKIVIGIVVAIIVLAFAWEYYSDLPSSDQVVTVSGKAEIPVTPDIVSLYFMVETEGKNEAEAKNKNANIVDAATVNMISAGIDQDVITTLDFEITEEITYNYQYDDYYTVKSTESEKVFKASHRIKVTIDDDSTVLIGHAIDAVVDAGGKFENMDFELSSSKESEYKAEATKQAAENAKAQAQAMADGLDMRVGKVISINNQNINNRYDSYRAYNAPSGAAFDAAEAKAAVTRIVTEIKPSDKKVTATMTVTYSLKQGFF